jgi:hypothetical protein
MRAARRPSLLLLLAFVLAVVPRAGALAQPAATPPAEPALAAIFRELAALKGVTSPGPPPPMAIRSREETRRFMEQELARRYSPARLEAERKAMVAWGLIPADYDLRRLFLDLLAEQVSAYYDPRAKTMVLGDWLTPAEQQAALLHELVHALQDREIPLEHFIAPVPGRGDQMLARQALIEGEAVGVMLDVVLRSAGGSLAALGDIAAVRTQIAAGSLGPVIQRAPRFLRDLLLFPYVEGLAFIHQWHKRNPWSATRDLYRDPPRSTAQILHPEQRLDARRDPIAITLPGLDALVSGLRPVTEDEMGEFGLGAVLGLALGEAEGRRAALGWRGDRYRIWEDGQGRFTIVYILVLESERVAESVGRSIATVVERRHPSVAGRGVREPAGNIVIWQDGPRTFLVERRGPEVLLLEMVPAGTTDRLRDAVWRARGANP